MLDRGNIATALAEERLPLFTKEIRATLFQINKGPPNPSPEAVLELIKRFPDHFSNLISRKTLEGSIKGNLVWSNPETRNEFHDIDVAIVCRYLSVAYDLQEHLRQISRKHLIDKYDRHLDRKKQIDANEALKQDEDRFFSFPGAFASNACWRYWGQFQYLTTDQCAALALGFDPEVVCLAKVEKAVGNGKSRILGKYRKTKLYFDSQHAKNTDKDRISWATFNRLAKNFDFHAQHRTHLQQSTPNSEGIEEKEFSAQAVHSLYKLIFSMSSKYYPELPSYLDEWIKYGKVDRNPDGSPITQIRKDLEIIVPTINEKNIRQSLLRAYRYAKAANILAGAKK